MDQVKQSFFNNEKGMTLIEVLASIVILTIILTGLLTVFFQSIKATETSDSTIDATYIAQTEMEYVYGLSKEVSFDSVDRKIEKEAEVNDKQYKITIELEPRNSLVNVIVKVTGLNQSFPPLAQMENLLEWGLSNED